MDWLGQLFLKQESSETITVGLITHRADIMSQDILDMLPTSAIVDALRDLWSGIMTVVDVFQGEYSGISFFESAEAFPAEIDPGFQLPRLSWFLTGNESLFTAASLYKLQYISGDVVFRLGEQTQATTSTLTICRMAFAVYAIPERVLPVPVFPATHRRFVNEGGSGGDIYIPRIFGQGGGDLVAAARLIGYLGQAGYSYGCMTYIEGWFGGDGLPSNHISIPHDGRYVTIGTLPATGDQIHYFLHGADVSGYPPLPYVQYVSFTSAYPTSTAPFSRVWGLASYIPDRVRLILPSGNRPSTVPPFIIPPDGGIPESEIPYYEEHGEEIRPSMLPALSAVGFLWFFLWRSRHGEVD